MSSEMMRSFCRLVTAYLTLLLLQETPVFGKETTFVKQISGNRLVPSDSSSPFSHALGDSCVDSLCGHLEAPYQTSCVQDLVHLCRASLNTKLSQYTFSSASESSRDKPFFEYVCPPGQRCRLDWSHPVAPLSTQKCQDVADICKNLDSEFKGLGSSDTLASRLLHAQSTGLHENGEHSIEEGMSGLKLGNSQLGDLVSAADEENTEDKKWNSRLMPFSKKWSDRLLPLSKKTPESVYPDKKWAERLPFLKRWSDRLTPFSKKWSDRLTPFSKKWSDRLTPFSKKWSDRLTPFSKKWSDRISPSFTKKLNDRIYNSKRADPEIQKRWSDRLIPFPKKWSDELMQNVKRWSDRLTPFSKKWGDRLPPSFRSVKRSDEDSVVDGDVPTPAKKWNERMPPTFNKRWYLKVEPLLLEAMLKNQPSLRNANGEKLLDSHADRDFGASSSGLDAGSKDPRVRVKRWSARLLPHMVPHSRRATSVTALSNNDHMKRVLLRRSLSSMNTQKRDWATW